MPDGSNVALLERPIETPVRLGRDYRVVALVGADNENIVQRRHPKSNYELAIEARQVNGSTGIIDHRNKTFLFHDVFLARNIETAEILAEELKGLFGDAVPSMLPGKDWEKRRLWNKLINPSEFPDNGPHLVTVRKPTEGGGFEEVEEFRFDEQFRDGDANNAFVTAMNSKGYRQISIDELKRSYGPSNPSA